MIPGIVASTLYPSQVGPGGVVDTLDDIFSGGTGTYTFFDDGFDLQPSIDDLNSVNVGSAWSSFNSGTIVIGFRYMSRWDGGFEIDIAPIRSTTGSDIIRSLSLDANGRAYIESGNTGGILGSLRTASTEVFDYLTPANYTVIIKSNSTAIGAQVNEHSIDQVNAGSFSHTAWVGGGTTIPSPALGTVEQDMVLYYYGCTSNQATSEQITNLITATDEYIGS